MTNTAYMNKQGTFLDGLGMSIAALVLALVLCLCLAPAAVALSSEEQVDDVQTTEVDEEAQPSQETTEQSEADASDDEQAHASRPLYQAASLQ